MQITHVASAGTVGLSTIDFKLTDRYADVPENQAFQLETLLPMEGCVYPYRHVAPATEHPFHRAALGIAADAVVIGAFVSPLKLSRRCLALWREVLARIPRARLAFSPVDPALRAIYERLFAAAGIAPDRCAVPAAGTRRRREPGALRARRLRARPDAVRRRQRHARGARHGRAGGHAAGPAARRAHVVFDPRQSRRDRHGRDERHANTWTSRCGSPPTRRSCATCAARIRAGLAASPLTDMPAHTRALERAYLAALAARAPEVLADAGESVDG